MDRYNILDFPLNPTLTIVRLIFRRVVQCESKGIQSAVQRCRGYTVLCLQTHKDLCIVQGTGAGEYASQLLKASCASYAKGLAPHALSRSCPRKHGISWISSNKIDFCPWNRWLWWTGYKTPEFTNQKCQLYQTNLDIYKKAFPEFGKAFFCWWR